MDEYKPLINGTTGAALLKRLGLLDQTTAQLRHVNDTRLGAASWNPASKTLNPKP